MSFIPALRIRSQIQSVGVSKNVGDIKDQGNLIGGIVCQKNALNTFDFIQELNTLKSY